MADALTHRQREILDFISASIVERGFPPTLREIGEHFQIRSTNGVNDHLKALEKKGHLRREDLKSRAMRPVLPDDREIRYERVEPRAEDPDRHALWRSYFLERKPALTGADVANAMGSYDPSSNRPVVLVDFTRAGAQLLADVTEKNVGKKLATILDGTIKSAPIVNGPIRGGKVSIAMGGTDPKAMEAERDELVNVLVTGSLPAPLREVR